MSRKYCVEPMLPFIGKTCPGLRNQLMLSGRSGPESLAARRAHAKLANLAMGVLVELAALEC